MKLKIYIDEAGRGPLAGPVVVGLILPISSDFDNSLFVDSKKISEKKRKEIFNFITNLEKYNKLFFSFGFSSNTEIDRYGIIKAINFAVKRGLLALFKKYILFYEKNILSDGDSFLILQKIKKKLYIFLNNIDFVENWNDFFEIVNLFNSLNKLYGIIIDGNTDFGLSEDLNFKIINVIKGDDKIPYVGAASIVAKVIRDDYMKDISKKFKNYGFDKHKGYGTAYHRKMIKLYGPCEVHRKTFIKL